MTTDPLYWAVNYLLSISFDKTGGFRFFGAHCIGELFCFFVFVFFPTTMVRPEIAGNSLFDVLLKMTYTVDSADNLLPSIHCFVSWLSFIGVRRCPKVPKWYRTASLIMAIAVCISTLTVKQHVLYDVFSGILLAEISFAISGGLARKNSK